MERDVGKEQAGPKNMRCRRAGPGIAVAHSPGLPSRSGTVEGFKLDKENVRLEACLTRFQQEPAHRRAYDWPQIRGAGDSGRSLYKIQKEV